MVKKDKIEPNVLVSTKSQHTESKPQYRSKKANQPKMTNKMEVDQGSHILQEFISNESSGKALITEKQARTKVIQKARKSSCTQLKKNDQNKIKKKPSLPNSPYLDRWRELDKKLLLATQESQNKVNSELTAENNTIPQANPQTDDSTHIIDEAALKSYFTQKKDSLFLETLRFCEQFIGQQISLQQEDPQNLKIGAAQQLENKPFEIDKIQISLSDQNSKASNFNIYTSAMLSIVLSHHFQKEEIQKLVNGTSVEFQTIRDTMYKYSKKAEERFFKNPVFAFFFACFSLSQNGVNYTRAKLTKSGEHSSGKKSSTSQINQPQIGQKQSHQAQMSARIIKEIQSMGKEAIRCLTRIKNSSDCEPHLKFMVDHSSQFLCLLDNNVTDSQLNSPSRIKDSISESSESEQFSDDQIPQNNNLTDKPPLLRVKSTQMSLEKQASNFLKSNVQITGLSLQPISNPFDPLQRNNMPLLQRHSSSTLFDSLNQSVFNRPRTTNISPVPKVTLQPVTQIQIPSWCLDDPFKKLQKQLQEQTKIISSSTKVSDGDNSTKSQLKLLNAGHKGQIN